MNRQVPTGDHPPWFLIGLVVGAVAVTAYLVYRTRREIGEEEPPISAEYRPWRRYLLSALAGLELSPQLPSDLSKALQKSAALLKAYGNTLIIGDITGLVDQVLSLSRESGMEARTASRLESLTSRLSTLKDEWEGCLRDSQAALRESGSHLSGAREMFAQLNRDLEQNGYQSMEYNSEEDGEPGLPHWSAYCDMEKSLGAMRVIRSLLQATQGKADVQAVALDLGIVISNVMNEQKGDDSSV